MMIRIAPHVALVALLATVGSIADGQTSAGANAESAFLQVELGNHAGPIRRIAAEPGRNLVVTGSDDKTARSWSLDTGQLQHIFRPPVGPVEIGRIYGVALHPSRPWIAIGGTSGTDAQRRQGHSIYIYNTDTAE